MGVYEYSILDENYKKNRVIFKPDFAEEIENQYRENVKDLSPWDKLLLSDDERIDLMQIMSKIRRSDVYQHYKWKEANRIFSYHPWCSYYPSEYNIPDHINKENIRVLTTIDNPGFESVVLYDRIYGVTFNISKEAFLKLILETKYPTIKRYNHLKGGFIWKKM